MVGGVTRRNLSRRQRRGLIRNQEYPQGYRGFESLALRQLIAATPRRRRGGSRRRSAVSRTTSNRPCIARSADPRLAPTSTKERAPLSAPHGLAKASTRAQERESIAGRRRVDRSSRAPRPWPRPPRRHDASTRPDRRPWTSCRPCTARSWSSSSIWLQHSPERARATTRARALSGTAAAEQSSVTSLSAKLSSAAPCDETRRGVLPPDRSACR